ncbi:hypothetical protein Mapa_012764 [Marchantia paleacea]|nr:hypothetical protein Mapa_012764 [Marchantia paleacea]
MLCTIAVFFLIPKLTAQAKIRMLLVFCIVESLPCWQRLQSQNFHHEASSLHTTES